MLMQFLFYLVLALLFGSAGTIIYIIRDECEKHK